MLTIYAWIHFMSHLYLENFWKSHIFILLVNLRKEHIK